MWVFKQPFQSESGEALSVAEELTFTTLQLVARGKSRAPARLFSDLNPISDLSRFP